MKAGTLLFVFADVVALLKSRGILRSSGDFDETMVDSLQEDAQLAADVAAILERHGVDLPDAVGAIIKALPVLSLFVKVPKPKPVLAGSPGD